MSDIADKANDQMQPMLDASIKHICNQSTIDINGPGYCIACKKKVDYIFLNERKFMPRWCSTKCRDGVNDDDE